MMSATRDADERIVCAILAEQVAALRDRMDGGASFELLWRTTALLSWVSGLLNDLSKNSHNINPVLVRENIEAIAKIAEIRHGLDELAFSQAQKQDFARQIADCVVTALERMSVAEMQGHDEFSLDDLSKLYVSDDQRRLHESVLRRIGT
ncbi:MAG: hypothetical protein POH28_05060 [Acidocella sp.]|nr:hypothetical protein [Acidocella sp.]